MCAMCARDRVRKGFGRVEAQGFPHRPGYGVLVREATKQGRVSR